MRINLGRSAKRCRAPLLSDVIAAGRFYSVDRTNGTVMGQSMRAFTAPNILPGNEYLFLGIRNEDASGVVRARLGVTNLTDEAASIRVDVRRQDGTLAGSFDRTAAPQRFSDWSIPKNITEEGELYTLVVTTSQPGYAYLSQVNRSNDPSTNYPLERRIPPNGSGIKGSHPRQFSTSHVPQS